jgi:nicotinate phosphoribosyltransferase
MSFDIALEPSEVPLLIDLYELTVAAAFFDRGMNDAAAFDVTLRKLPPGRGFMVAAGIERLAEALERLRFDTHSIDHLRSLTLFKPEFLDYLASMRFTGSVHALAEGSIFFGGEPVAEIRAPLIEAQVVETLALNQLAFACSTATKAARIVAVAGGRRVVDFGARRAHGADAALIAARSSYLAGFHGSSNVLAGKRYGIPVFGTMSHSFVMAHAGEREAFREFAATYPAGATLLVDTYDTIAGVRNAVAIARGLLETGGKIAAVRLDSGDLLDLSRKSRRVLDDANLRNVSIFASGNLDEYKIAELVESRAPIDAFGVGTAIATCNDAPDPEFTYKLVQYAGRGRIKTSAGKVSTPGLKQIFRAFNADGTPVADLVGLADESIHTVSREFKPLAARVETMLAPILDGGHRVNPRPTLNESRARAAAEIASIDPRLKQLRRPAEYPVRHSAALASTVISEKLRAAKRQDG